MRNTGQDKEKWEVDQERLFIGLGLGLQSKHQLCVFIPANKDEAK
jgi:hypothetical protein